MYNFIPRNKWQEGQMLLTVIVVMVITLTVGLSVAVRSMTNLRTSSEDENSQRAFSAAEAGIERALVNAAPNSTINFTNNTSSSTSIGTVSGSGFTANNGVALQKDEPVDVWLSNYPDYTSPWSGSMTVNWGAAGEPTCSSDETTNLQSALEIVVISGSKAAPSITEYQLDPCAGRSSSNNFQTPTTPGDNFAGKLFAHKQSINISSGLIARIVPLYAPAIVGIEASPATLPSQGTIVSSTGVSDNTKRKIVSFREFPRLPLELFPFVFFSPK